ncbi:MAG: CocE/NonD family hydrolase [Alkaliphilus sp.]
MESSKIKLPVPLIFAKICFLKERNERWITIIRKNVAKRFAYYSSGNYLAEIIFEQDVVIQKGRKGTVNIRQRYESLENEEDVFGLPLYRMNELIKGLEKACIDFNKFQFTLEGHHYQRDKRESAYINGELCEAWIWGQYGGGIALDLIISRKQIIGFIYTTLDSCKVLVKSGYEALTPLNRWEDDLLSRANFTIKHEGTSFVLMRDGIKLATDVWIPRHLEGGNKLPTILVRTPYGRLSAAKKQLQFVARGYALVVQDTRGREDSEGEWSPKIHEMDDGDDIINWIVAQPWSNGKVGMIGASYSGFVQWAAAASGNPHLKAIVSLVTAGSPFVDIPRRGGALVSGMLPWSFMMSEKYVNKEAMVRDDWEEVLSIRPIREIPKKALKRNLPFWDQWMANADDNEFWTKANWSIHGDKIDVPALMVSGWYDDNGMGTTEAWKMNEKYNRNNTKLVLGPWMHKANSTREINNVVLGNDAIRYDLDLLYLRWFDRFLKDVENGVEKEGRVEFYLVGENEWHKVNEWSPEKVRYTNIYFHSGGDARTCYGNGSITTSVPIEESKDSYIFDPSDAAPHLIDLSENELCVPANYKEVEKRDDVLVYTSQPLKEDVAIAGDIYATIYASSSARDTDWVVRLTEVDEDGNSIRLSDGLIRARYRNSYECPELLEPNKVEKYEINMTKIASVFRKGNRIRVEITSGAKNFIFPNHNTGKNPVDDIGTTIATQVVHHSVDHPSHVKLPVLYGNLVSSGDNLKKV